ncbi:MAG: hypothetical protein UMR38_01450 [Candidatus Izemoplasma sp.]|nr:hypothetical protein [Candidatus Izemoplasma sp.]
MTKIDKIDLAYVVVASLLGSLIVGVFYGLTNYLLMRLINTGLTIIFLLLIVFLGNNIRKQYQITHWLYGVIAIISVLNAYLLSLVTFQVLLFGFDLLPFFMRLFYHPVYIGQLLNPFPELFSNISNTFEWIILVISMGLIYQRTTN